MSDNQLEEAKIRLVEQLNEKTAKLQETNQHLTKSLEDTKEISPSEEKMQETHSQTMDSVSNDQVIAKEYTEAEKLALSKGWKPRDQYYGDNWIEAEEYNRVGGLFKRISEQNKEIKEIKDLLRQTTEHLSNTQRTAYERALKDLEVQKLKAVELGDKESYLKLDNTTKDIEVAKSKDPFMNVTSKIQPEVSPEVLNFYNKTKDVWYNTNNSENASMKDYADSIDNYLVREATRRGQAINTKEHLQLIEQEVQKRYPHRFNNPKREEPSTVGKSTAIKEKVISSSDLISKFTEEQRQLALHFERTSKGKYTQEMYAKDLQAQGNLGKR